MATKIVEVHPGIYEIFLPLPMRPTIINVYLLDCHGAWALVDTGTFAGPQRDVPAQGKGDDRRRSFAAEDHAARRNLP
jgi:hypothetical protein